MKVLIADTQLTDDVLLYPMQGFYCLSVPLKKPITGFNKAFIGENCLVLLSDTMVLVVSVNRKVSAILRRQMQLVSDKPNVLGITTRFVNESDSIHTLDFAHYQTIESLVDFVSKKQVARIMTYNEERHSEKT